MLFVIFRLFEAILFGDLWRIYSVVCGGFIRLFVDFMHFMKDYPPCSAPSSRSNFLFAARCFSPSARHFFLSYKIVFVTNFVTRITNFVTCIRNFVTLVTKFVINYLLYDSDKYQGGRKKCLIGAGKISRGKWGRERG